MGVRELAERPRSIGFPPLCATIMLALSEVSEVSQRCCVEVLCTLCRGGATDAYVARALANAMVLSKCGRLPATAQQLAVLRSATALTEEQREALMRLFANAEGTGYCMVNQTFNN